MSDPKGEAAGPAAPLAVVLAPTGDEVRRRLGVILACRLGGDGQPAIEAWVSGNINGILKLRYEGRLLGVRLALNTYRFRYEKDIIKEIFALFLIYFARDADNDRVARDIVDGVLANPIGGHIGHTLVRRVVHYDWSMTTLPWPFFIFEWVEGEILWNQASPDAYAAAGRNLARLHRIGFQSYYRDIFKIGREPLSWHQRFEAALSHERRQALPRLTAAAAARLEALDVAGLDAAPPCLVHNDYSGGNIIVEPDGGQKIIDWDNWLVEAPELDLMKMKYWTAIGADGLLAPHPPLFSAFLEGYNSLAATAPEPRRLRAYEALWLARAFNFESARLDGAEPATGATQLSRHYPPAASYQAWLTEL